ncbi:MAG TPA: aspartate/glutamate racemase family protein [Conexibacter sp.]|nr:aspartate/glutamate racemase family protein [Conexibacter sp.]
MSTRILLINANTTASMTAAMLESAAETATPGTELLGATAEHGVASIDGYHDEVLGAVAVAEAIRSRDGEFDAAVIACFGDPGLHAARELTERPVVGIAEASFLAAMTLGQRFSVLTTLDRGVPPIEDVVVRYGLTERCASVRASGLTVLEADASPELAADALEREGERAVREDRADVLCLGCGGMVGLRERLERRLGVPVLEGVPVAVALAEALVRCGLSTSKVRGFKHPEPNVYS